MVTGKCPFDLIRIKQLFHVMVANSQEFSSINCIYTLDAECGAHVCAFICVVRSTGVFVSLSLSPSFNVRVACASFRITSKRTIAHVVQCTRVVACRRRDRVPCTRHPSVRLLTAAHSASSPVASRQPEMMSERAWRARTRTSERCHAISSAQNHSHTGIERLCRRFGTRIQMRYAHHVLCIFEMYNMLCTYKHLHIVHIVPTTILYTNLWRDGREKNSSHADHDARVLQTLHASKRIVLFLVCLL